MNLFDDTRSCVWGSFKIQQRERKKINTIKHLKTKHTDTNVDRRIRRARETERICYVCMSGFGVCVL